uniref:LRAT domain-containing protein n=1 Tax=Biomphalaria glabrata TaxID=6526 RepID=A0A2C9L8F8_BIOGL
MKPTKTYERNSKTYPIDGKKQFLECHHFNLLRTLEPGDIIKISRTFFNHWGIYVGNNSVVHVSVCNSGNSLTSAGLPVSNIFREPRMEAVVKQSFYRVVGDDYAECSSKNDSHKRPLPQASIVLNATSEIGPIQYQPLYKNCEHFVNKCRYGQEKSSQTQAAVLGLGAASGYAGFLLAGPIGAIAATGFSLYKLYQHAQKNTPEDVKKRNTYFHQF